jgi:hypothetical protein
MRGAERDEEERSEEERSGEQIANGNTYQHTHTTTTHVCSHTQPLHISALHLRTDGHAQYKIERFSPSPSVITCEFKDVS